MKIVTSGAERNTNVQFGEEKCTVRLNVTAKLCILGEVVIVKKKMVLLQK